jgi:predicted CXXCH cytochrome family protein
MTDERKISLTLAALTAVFAALAVAFDRVPARPAAENRPPLTSPQALAGVIPPGTVRISAGELIRTGGDTSVLACYSCHDQKHPPVVKFDDQHRAILPKEHADLIIAMRNCSECHSAARPVKLEYTDDGTVIIPEAHRNLAAMAHGRNARNENCYTCHEQDHLDRLHTPEGAELTFDQATLLCAGCHGPNYRDWEAGIHGRTSGHWDRTAGPITRQECTSCHDPHAPAFTGLIPMPAPHRSNRVPAPLAQTTRTD